MVEYRIDELLTKPISPSSQQMLEKSKRFELDFEQYSLQALSKRKGNSRATRPKSPLRTDQQLYLLAKTRVELDDGFSADRRE
jgi:hypothetical protein